MQHTDRFLTVSLVNEFLRNGITVTLQWPREVGADYHVNVLPVAEVTGAMSLNRYMTSLTISYDIQYNVSITSNLCGVIKTEVLKYGK